jgi:general secretion pathway protein M
MIAVSLVVVLALVQWLIRPILSRRQQMETSIQRTEQRLQELLDLEQTYRQVLAESAKVAKDLSERQQGFTLFAFLESLASRDGLKNQIEYMRPSVKTLSDAHQEEQVEMRLNGVTLAILVPYLYHIETAPEQVRINRLTIRPQQKNRSLLEVNLVVVTPALREAPRAADSKSARNPLKQDTIANRTAVGVRGVLLEAQDARI